MKIEKIMITNKEYPEKLKNIYDSPNAIYVLGDKEILKEKAIAIVGNRQATEYGKKIALQMAKDLTEKGINIISGLAIGIDTCAHIGSLKAQMYGKTIAILGSGIDEIYPKENVELARQIIKSGGCIISEYPLGTKPNKKNFPQRNRLISALSDGVLVVEAGIKSGALITADFAIEQGKEVFAIPGDINKDQSIGCNLLIKDGAKIVTVIQDILEEL